MNDEAVERIESRISFLERANEELSDTVFRQEQEIGALKAQLNALSARMVAWTSEQTEYSPEQEKPPHY
jgi:SlyX protein